jgi:MFS family permease
VIRAARARSAKLGPAVSEAAEPLSRRANLTRSSLANRLGRWLPALSPDGWLLFASAGVRFCAYGFVSVILGLYLAALGLGPVAIEVVFTAALAGGAILTVVLTTVADRFGRRRVLMLGAVLMAVGGVLLALTESSVPLLVGAALGTISPSGREVGPFRSLEPAMLPQIPTDGERTVTFAAYNIVGLGAFALDALAAGLPSVLGFAPLPGFRLLIGAYAAAGVLLFLLARPLALAMEAPSQPHTARQPGFALRRSLGVVLKLGPLFALDSRASGLMVQSIATYWFHLRSGVAVAGLRGHLVREQSDRRSRSWPRP